MRPAWVKARSPGQSFSDTTGYGIAALSGRTLIFPSPALGEAGRGFPLLIIEAGETVEGRGFHSSCKRLRLKNIKITPPHLCLSIILIYICAQNQQSVNYCHSNKRYVFISQGLGKCLRMRHQQKDY